MSIAGMKYRLAVDLDAHIADPDWHAEPKYDGVRAIVHITARGIHVTGGGGGELKSTRAMPVVDKLKTALRPHADRLAADMRAHGRDDWHLALDGEVLRDPVDRYVVFDLPVALPNWDVGDAPWELRRSARDQLIDTLDHPLIVHAETADTTEAKQELADRMWRRGGEGLVVKHTQGKYRPGKRVDHMLKAKFTSTADCIVLERGPGNGRNGTGNWLRLGVYKPVDGLDEQGGIRIGPSVEITHELVEIGRCSTIGKPYAKQGDVVEVKYLYRGAGGKLVQPTMLRVRDDKAADECSLDQFRDANPSAAAAV